MPDFAYGSIWNRTGAKFRFWGLPEDLKIIILDICYEKKGRLTTRRQHDTTTKMRTTTTRTTRTTRRTTTITILWGLSVSLALLHTAARHLPHFVGGEVELTRRRAPPLTQLSRPSWSGHFTFVEFGRSRIQSVLSYIWTRGSNHISTIFSHSTRAALVCLHCSRVLCVNEATKSVCHLGAGSDGF